MIRRLLRRGYRPGVYWEGRAQGLIETYDHPETWTERGWLREGAEDEAVPDFLRSRDCESVLVLGAGSGRQYDYLSEFEIVGFDISPTLVAECRDRFPGIETVVGDVVGCEKLFGVRDAVVSSAVLAHVPPQRIAAAVQSVKESATRAIVLREYVELPVLYPYQFAHDYVRLLAPWQLVREEQTDDIHGHIAKVMCFAPGAV